MEWNRTKRACSISTFRLKRLRLTRKTPLLNLFSWTPFGLTPTKSSQAKIINHLPNSRDLSVLLDAHRVFDLRIGNRLGNPFVVPGHLRHSGVHKLRTPLAVPEATKHLAFCWNFLRSKREVQDGIVHFPRNAEISRREPCCMKLVWGQGKSLPVEWSDFAVCSSVGFGNDQNSDK